MVERIYDNPNHVSYGPVRRMWVMLCGLYGFDHSGLDRAFREEWWFDWDTHVHCMMTMQGYPEGYALQRALHKILDLDAF